MVFSGTQKFGIIRGYLTVRGFFIVSCNVCKAGER